MTCQFMYPSRLNCEPDVDRNVGDGFTFWVGDVALAAVPSSRYIRALRAIGFAQETVWLSLHPSNAIR